ncbi:predicted protein [Chaetomium globosum CBS 148.51]|uniref:Uncharacterized protein n=1 Tax=Chaetomium globosum (strain ATCC 6205 / CBS 148.51 / DSM 1962 / NBRC 6347 / NRRL 1970) TaxID=306901 RepID=Q2GN58_CHAGB|nr:uncharacterized protein CHGG_10596 [Chaetomium globosum CBS 148.51]EAQ84192.1 predicted protein [Chaetomium globosum CBS 148.51]
MPNRGKCTNSITNPNWTQWKKANPGNKLNPNIEKIACPCRAFVAKDASKPDKKCTCNHDNKLHMP